MKACFNLPRVHRDTCFSPETIAEIGALVDLDGEAPDGPVTAEWLLPRMADCEIIITGWGSLRLDQRVLEAAQKLVLVLHSAGSIKHLEDPAFWARHIRITSAANANGIPVAEFLLGQILMAFKDVFAYQNRFRESGRAAWRIEGGRLPGYYRSTVGIIGMGNVGKHLLKLLDLFQMRVLAHSFYPFEAQAAAHGVTLCGIDELMAASDAVVLLAPNIPSNRHMIGARRLGLMRDGAWFLNAGRGALVDEAALLAELRSGRLNACLDVFDPEPPAEGSPFYSLPNCVITPHVAGSIGSERLRLGDQVLRELRHFLRGEPFENEITAELAPVIG